MQCTARHATAPQSAVELRLGRLHAAHGHGVQPQQGVQLGPVMLQQHRVGGEQLSEHTELGDGLGLVSCDKPTLDHVLYQHHME